VRYFGRVTAPESAPGLDSVVSPISSENEINFEAGSASVPFVRTATLVPARITGLLVSELHRKTNFNGPIARQLKKVRGIFGIAAHQAKYRSA
jgi:hypothetical protein